MDAFVALTHVFDGYFIQRRGEGAAALDGTSLSAKQVPKNLSIRTDLHVPVFMFETQTDHVALGYAAAQQPNTTPESRTWEVAGTLTPTPMRS